MSLYDILGVGKDATNQEIKEAYKDMAKKHHPDKGGDTKKMAEVNNAYMVLSDKSKRERYDRTGDDGAETPFEIKFATFIDAVFIQAINQINDLDTTDLIEVFKGQVNEIMVNLESQKTNIKKSIAKYEIVMKRLKSKKDTSIKKLLEQKIYELKKSQEKTQDEIAFVVDCEKVLDDYSYDFDEAKAQSYIGGSFFVSV